MPPSARRWRGRQPEGRRAHFLAVLARRLQLRAAECQELTAEVAAASDADGRLQEVLAKQEKLPGLNREAAPGRLPRIGVLIASHSRARAKVGALDRASISGDRLGEMLRADWCPAMGLSGLELQAETLPTS